MTGDNDYETPSERLDEWLRDNGAALEGKHICEVRKLIRSFYYIGSVGVIVVKSEGKLIDVYTPINTNNMDELIEELDKTTKNRP